MKVQPNIVLQNEVSGTPHPSDTPLKNSGTPLGVQYTQLTSTVLEEFADLLELRLNADHLSKKGFVTSFMGRQLPPSSLAMR